MTKRQNILGIIAAGLFGSLAACSASGESPRGDNGAGGAGGARPTPSGVGGGGTGGVDFNPFDTGGSGPTPSGVGGGETCAGETTTAELVPLDLYIMLDSSGSMLEPTLLGASKWDAVKQALTSFFNDPQSADIGAGLQYFPYGVPGVPDICSSDTQCSGHGPCVFRICQNEYRFQNKTHPCEDNTDCGFLDTCVGIGECSGSGTGCLPVGANCASGEGVCNAITESFCYGKYSCEVGDYAAPDVAIGPLSATAGALIASMEAKQPNGGTPTSAALSGAIEQARNYAAANTGRKVVAVLATDGLPTDCDPVDAAGIAQIAAAGRSGSPSISTFVIGVFAGLDLIAQNTLNQIAASGGTAQAIFVDANQNVTQSFLNALNDIRGKSLACEYQIPAPTGGQQIDLGQVNVEHTREGGSAASTIYYVSDAQGCDAANGGWYYDVDPASGGTPTKIVMCPSTCTLFQQGGEVDIRVGCKTEQIPR